jgi:hypothetical protein
VDAAYDAAAQNLKEIDKLCRDVITVDVKGTRPSVVSRKYVNKVWRFC